MYIIGEMDRRFGKGSTGCGGECARENEKRRDKGMMIGDAKRRWESWGFEF